jgi:hypothetical protein
LSFKGCYFFHLQGYIDRRKLEDGKKKSEIPRQIKQPLAPKEMTPNGNIFVEEYKFRIPSHPVFLFVLISRYFPQYVLLDLRFVPLHIKLCLFSVSDRFCNEMKSGHVRVPTGLWNAAW